MAATSKFDASKLRELRQLRGLSQEEMARRAGVDERTIRRAELGRTIPHGETLRIFAMTLGVSLETLFAPEREIVLPVAPVIDGSSAVPAIAVLPLLEHDALGRRSSGALAGALHESLIIQLGLLRLFAVISRNAALSCSDPVLAPRDVCERLGASYVIEGSLRTDGERVRVIAYLVEGSSGRQLWSDQYEVVTSDGAVVVSQIAARVAASVAPALLRHEMRRVMRPSSGDVTAWSESLRGLWYLERRNGADNRMAREHFAHASALDPGFVLPWYGTAMSHYAELFNAWSDQPEQTASALLDAAREARDIDCDDPQSLLAEAYASMVSSDPERAVACLERVIELTPGAVRARLLLGVIMAGRGNAERAIEIVDSGIALSPADPLRWAFEAAIAVAHLTTARHRESLTWLQRAARSGPPDVMVQSLLGGLYAQLGDTAGARRHVERVRRTWPGFSLENAQRMLVSMQKPQRELVIGTLSHAASC